MKSFKRSEHNAKALQAASSFIRDFIPGQTKYGVIFAGSVGTGKTHLAAAIARELAQEKGVEARFVDLRELFDKLKATYGTNSTISQNDFLRPIFGADLVILDELGAARPTDWIFEMQELLICSLYNRTIPTIVTTNLANLPAGSNEGADYARAARPDTLGDRIGARAFSRLQQMCITAEINGPDWRRGKKC